MSSGSGVPAPAAAWWRALSERVREKELRRQRLYDRSRKTLVRRYLESRARAALPPLLRDYLEKLGGALLAFWLMGALLSLLRAQPVYTFLAFGLFYSLQSAYYGYRLMRDPDFRIPHCKCASAAKDGSEAVLRSGIGKVGRAPLAAVGAVLYVALGGLLLAGLRQPALLLAALAVPVNAYLGYAMIFRIRALCINCINLGALNLLILWQLLR